MKNQNLFGFQTVTYQIPLRRDVWEGDCLDDVLYYKERWKNRLPVRRRMMMYTEIGNVLSVADKDVRYDEYVKQVLGHKHILAWILVKTVDEFAGMDPKNVVLLIEGEPYIGEIPVELGLTNEPDFGVAVDESLQENDLSITETGEKAESPEKKQKIRMRFRTVGDRIVGANTENKEVHEGYVVFDIVFYVRTKNGLMQIIINVEAQKANPKEYDLLNRAVFYACRLISSQKQRDFVHQDFDGMHRVFSIWICLGMPENSLSIVRLKKEELLGTDPWTGGLDKINVVTIGLSDTVPEHDEKYELHRLLGTLLSTEMKTDEKLNIIENEYDIPFRESEKEVLNIMCNLGEGIREKEQRNTERERKRAELAEQKCAEAESRVATAESRVATAESRAATAEKDRDAAKAEVARLRAALAARGISLE